MTFVPSDPPMALGSSTPRAATPGNDDEAKREALLAKLRDDRKDLERVAGVVRDVAETFEVAQHSLAILRGSLRWLALVGGVAAVTMAVRTRRRPPALLLTGLSLYLVQRWLSHPVRHGLATAPHPVIVGKAGPADAPSPPHRGAIAPSPVRLYAV